MDEVTHEDMARARRVLEEVARWHDARGEALEATGLTGFLERRHWLDIHPVRMFAPESPLSILDRELSTARADGLRIDFSSRSVPKEQPKRRRHEFTATELRIADEVEARRSA